MALDHAQQKTLVEWMYAKNIRRECSECGTPDDWTPGDIVAAPVFKPSGLHIGERMTPILEIVCNNCGHIRLFAAEPIGIYQEHHATGTTSGEVCPEGNDREGSTVISA